jgi:hypothetical protein
MRVGITVIPRIKDVIIAMVFVYARGLNIFPSCASRKNTGKKLIIVVKKPTRIALDTSLILL